jgi:hypothetical protein
MKHWPRSGRGSGGCSSGNVHTKTARLSSCPLAVSPYPVPAQSRRRRIGHPNPSALIVIGRTHLLRTNTQSIAAGWPSSPPPAACCSSGAGAFAVRDRGPSEPNLGAPHLTTGAGATTAPPMRLASARSTLIVRSTHQNFVPRGRMRRGRPRRVRCGPPFWAALGDCGARPATMVSTDRDSPPVPPNHSRPEPARGLPRSSSRRPGGG